MTIEEITLRLVEIEQSRGDDEVAHQLEDKLYIDFITYVSHQPFYIAEKAKKVLEAKSIAFSRWYS